jgi:hypothetical protein
MDWNKILNWRLLSGSHKFPGPDGGTCINEVAIVAAGFQYSSIASANDCPPCFSRVLSSYAISLNDNMPDDLRQSLLLPFVTRLAGTADAPEIERQRFDFIMVGIVCKCLPFLLRGWEDGLATECAAVRNYDDAIKAVNNIAHGRLARALTLGLANELVLARDLTLDRNLTFERACVNALACTTTLTLALVCAPTLDLQRYTALVALLDGAMKIGKQAEPIEIALVVDRLAKIRTLKHVLTGSAMTTWSKLQDKESAAL